MVVDLDVSAMYNNTMTTTKPSKDTRSNFALRFDEQEYPKLKERLVKVAKKHRYSMTDVILSGTKQRVEDLEKRPPGL